MGKLLNIVYKFKIYVEIYLLNQYCWLILHQQTTSSLNTLWGDETFGRHALSSRGWGSQDKQSVEPTLLLVRPTRVDH
jgi:hypothetical protein